MKRKFFLLNIFFIGIILSINMGCAGKSQPLKSQLEIRSYQTKVFDTKNTKLVMKAVVDTLQDNGFIIKNANTDLGIIVATKEADIESKTQAFFATLLFGYQARWKKVQQVESSVNVSPFGGKTKVRAVFTVKVLDNKGNPVEIINIDNPKYYQDFFSKVNKSLFVLQEKI
ncbi:hypothetical protein [Persephonella sp.]